MSNAKIVVVSSSLSVKSRSRVMCHYAVKSLTHQGCEATLLDLAQVELLSYPKSEASGELKRSVEQFNAAHGWVLASPVYNFGATGVLLNFLHYALDSDYGRWKPFVLLASLGGQRSAMSLDHLARTMVYEVSAVQVGSSLNNYGDSGVNRETGEMSEELRQRMDTQLAVLAQYAKTRAGME